MGVNEVIRQNKKIIILNLKCKAMLSYCLKCEKIQKT